MLTDDKAVAECPFFWNDTATGACSKQSLQKNQIHLWMVSLNGFATRYACSSKNGCSTTAAMSDLSVPPDAEILTQAENKRASRIVNNARRKDYLGGRVGLRTLLSAYTGISNAELEFGYGSRGKPRLLNTVSKRKLAFNYSLSRGYALYAFGWDMELGVDLEIFPRTISTDRLAKRILTEREQGAWHSVDQAQRHHAMLACWTRKEAYGKVLGVGIRYNMNQVNLFTDLQQARWCSTVSGLFDNEAACSELFPQLLPPQSLRPLKQPIQQLQGVQLALPVCGVASLMYAENTENTMPANEAENAVSECNRAGSVAISHNPELSTFQLYL